MAPRCLSSISCLGWKFACMFLQNSINSINAFSDLRDLAFYGFTGKGACHRALAAKPEKTNTSESPLSKENFVPSLSTKKIARLLLYKICHNIAERSAATVSTSKMICFCWHSLKKMIALLVRVSKHKTNLFLF